MESVYLFEIWQKTPTYHDYGRIKKYDDGCSEDVTACGLTMYDGETRYRALLRRDHADLFAKPCGKCFRQVRDSAPSAERADQGWGAAGG